MQSKTILITGANGEIGHLLLPKIASLKPKKIITLDLHYLHDDLVKFSQDKVEGSVTDKLLIKKTFSKNKIDIVIHLAAKLSTSSEKNPEQAFETNVEGTNFLLMQAAKTKNVLFFYPSSIAAYGIPSLEIKNKENIAEENYNNPITLYGIHKIYGEMLGRYYDLKGLVDFRCIRFPGLMSTDTIPGGGTSDFGPEIIHHFARHKNYSCYARENSYLPFMAMPDAIDAIVKLIKSPKEKLKQHIYNVASFSSSPKEIIEVGKNHFEKIDITFNNDSMRQNILDSWPAVLDDTAAREDWNWKPKYDFKSAFEDYLIPGI